MATTVYVATFKGEIFDFQIGLSRKQQESIEKLLMDKNVAMGLNRYPDHDNGWSLDSYEIPSIVEFIQNINQGFIEDNIVYKMADLHNCTIDEAVEKVSKMTQAEITEFAKANDSYCG